jgi:glycerol kinase
MAKATRTRLRTLKVDGGAAANDYLLQFQADVSDARVVRPTVVETTALGAAYLAGLATGVWSDTKAIAEQWQAERTFAPRMSKRDRERTKATWRRAVDRARGWV